MLLCLLKHDYTGTSSSHATVLLCLLKHNYTGSSSSHAAVLLCLLKHTSTSLAVHPRMLPCYCAAVSAHKGSSTTKLLFVCTYSPWGTFHPMCIAEWGLCHPTPLLGLLAFPPIFFFSLQAWPTCGSTPTQSVSLYNTDGNGLPSVLLGEE